MTPDPALLALAVVALALAWLPLPRPGAISGHRPPCDDSSEETPQ